MMASVPVVGNRVAVYLGSILVACLSILTMAKMVPAMDPGFVDGQSQAAPWGTALIDLGVYLEAGERVWARPETLYSWKGQLPFIYPPFAAVVMAPLSLAPALVAGFLWVALSMAVFVNCLERFGLSGARLIGVVIFAVTATPIRDSLFFGQVSLLLVGLTICLLANHKGEVGGNGWGSGVAAAIKLTPAAFVFLFLFSGNLRAAKSLVFGFLAATLIGIVLLPKASFEFWTELLRGETGLGDSVVYAGNQSIIGSWVRLVGPGSPLVAAAFVVSLAVVLVDHLLELDASRLASP